MPSLAWTQKTLHTSFFCILVVLAPYIQCVDVNVSLWGFSQSPQPSYVAAAQYSLQQFHICCDRGFNLKHMGGYLTFSVCEYYISQQCICSQSYAHIYQGTHRHVVPIIGPISNETHPLPICCTPPVKIFLLIYNNNLQTFLQPRTDQLCYQNRSSD